MWILEWIPNWFFYLILLIGVVGFISTFLIRFLPIPFISLYKAPIQLVSIVLIVFGTFMIGAVYNNDSWLAKVKALEAKVAIAEQEAKKETVRIETKIIEKTKIVREKGEQVIQYIDREVIKYDSQCVIPNEFIKALNDAAEIKQ
jgi:hypothetical protein